MLVRRTSETQITLPVEIVQRVPAAAYFDVTVEDGAIVLRPVRVVPAVDVEALRDAVAWGAVEDDVAEAVAWARRGG
jgi:hypothetical protein